MKAENEETREEVQRFSCFFYFLSKALSRESYNRRVGFSFCKIGREDQESKCNFESLFSPWKRKVGEP